MVKIKYNRPKGHRLKNVGFRFLSSYWDNACSLWWSEEYNKWVLDTDDAPYNFLSSCVPCKSLRAAIRMVEKADVPNGTRFVLESKYRLNNPYGTPFDIILTKRGGKNEIRK